MPRKLFRKYLPSAASVTANKYLRPFARFLGHPNLWHLNRRSVAGGVAVGMFCGLVPGPLQMLSAAILAIPLRVNLPVALFTTLYTNPITIVPLYILAFAIGSLITGTSDSMAVPPDFSWTHAIDSMMALGQWMVSLGKPLAIGLLALASGLAISGYCAVQIGWRWHVQREWRRRAERRRG